MADSPGRVLPFPSRPSPARVTSYKACPAQADAELRADMLRELLDDLVIQEQLETDYLRILAASLAANALLNELVVLYRRAISQVQGGAWGE